MAVSRGSAALGSDMQDWYNRFNTILSRYSNGIATLTVPGRNSSILASNINNLNTKITAMKSDKWLGTVASYWTNQTVSAGTAITPPSGITSTIGNFGRVVCKNTATNNKGNHNQGCGRGNHDQCCDTNGNHSQTCGNGKKDDGGCYNGLSTFQTNRNGWNNRGTNGNACSNGRHGNCCNTNSTNSNTCANTSTIVVTCSRASNSN